MKVFIRTDATSALGTGHLMRCLALAGALRRLGNETTFLCQAIPQPLAARVEVEGHGLILLPEITDRRADAMVTAAALSRDRQILVVDHYGLDAEWESTLRGRVTCLMAIDDGPTRAHDCDILLDQNLQMDAEVRYRPLASAAKLLLGPAYALLRPEFVAARASAKMRRQIGRLWVSFGGSDPTDETAKSMAAIAHLKSALTDIDVVLGPAYDGQVEEGMAAMPGAVSPRFHRSLANLAPGMASADLALGAGGISTWERCCVGLPALCIAVADNQIAVAQACHEAGLLRYLGTSPQVPANAVTEAIDAMIRAPAELERMSARAFDAVDGLGAERVAHAMMAAMGERAS